MEDGPRRTEPQPPPTPRCRGTVPELIQHADRDSHQGMIGPEPEECPDGRQDQAERECVGSDRTEATNLTVFKTRSPPPPLNRELASLIPPCGFENESVPCPPQASAGLLEIFGAP